MWGALRMAKNAAITMTKTSISLKANTFPAIHHTWANMYPHYKSRETSTLLARCLPVPCLSVLNIFNLRDLLEKTLEESELGLSRKLDDILALGTLLSGTVPCSRIISFIQLT